MTYMSSESTPSPFATRKRPALTPVQRDAAKRQRSDTKGIKTARGTTFASIRVLEHLAALWLVFVKGPCGESATETAAKVNGKCGFGCRLCGHEFEASGNNVVGLGRACPFCSYPPQKICDDADCTHCATNSLSADDISKDFAARRIAYDVWMNLGESARAIFRGSDAKKWFACLNPACSHVFLAGVGKVVGYKKTKGRGCPYCCATSEKFCPADDRCAQCIAKSLFGEETRLDLAANWTIAIGGPLNSDGNTRRPLEETARRCQKKCRFMCTRFPDVREHGEFDATASHVVGNGSGCPKCVNKSEHAILSLVEKELEDLDDVDIFEIERDRALPSSERRRYDMVIRLSNGVVVVVEIDGAQHFRAVVFGSHTTDPLEQRKIDVFKTLAALSDGAFVIRVATSKGGVTRGARLRRLGDTVVDAVRAIANGEVSSPRVECIDDDEPGCYDQFFELLELC